MLNLRLLSGRVWHAAALTGVIAAATVAYSAPDPDPVPPGPAAEKAVGVHLPGGSFLGVGVSEITSERAKALNLKDEYGVEITHVEEDSPAQKGGLKVADVVVEYNGQRVEGMEQFMRLVRETPPGREVKLSLVRNGGLQDVVVKTGSRKMWAAKAGTYAIELPNVVIPDIQIPDIPKAYMSWRSPMLGIEAESIDNQLAQFFGVKEGVLVRSVLKGTVAEKAGLKAGDVIVKVDWTAVSNPKDISTAIRSARGKKTATLGIVRERKEMTVTIALEERGGEPDSGRNNNGQKAIRVSGN